MQARIAALRAEQEKKEADAGLTEGTSKGAR